VPSAASVFSNARIIPEQLAWLAGMFGAQQSPYGEGFSVELGSGFMDAVGLEDGTDDIGSMPVGAENSGTSCDLHILVHKAAEPVSSQRPA
jgi:hypothetical protein